MSLFKYFLLLALVVLILGQRGGGRGGGGGGGSRGGSRGFGGGAIFFGSRWLNTCNDKCIIENRFHPILLPACLQQCRIRNRNNAILTFATVFLLMCGCAVCAQYLQRKSPEREPFVEQLQARFQKVSTTFMTEEQFEIERQQFEHETWRFHFFQLNQETQNYQVRWTFQKEAPFVYEIRGQGRDDIGIWTSHGIWFCSETGIKFWMLKDYEDKEEAGQTGSFEILVYEGEQKSRSSYEGVWYYAGYEIDPAYSGRWSMVGLYEAKPANPYLASPAI